MSYQPSSLLGSFKPEESKKPLFRMQCPRCKGRLFLETEYMGTRVMSSLHCMTCGRDFQIQTTPVPTVLVQ